MTLPTASAVTWSMAYTGIKARRIGSPEPVSWPVVTVPRVEVVTVVTVPRVEVVTVPNLPEKYPRRPLAEVEKEHILNTLRANRGSRKQTAHDLRIGKRTLGLKLKAWGLSGVRCP